MTDIDPNKPEVDCDDAREAADMGEKPDLGRTPDALIDALSGSDMGSDTRAGSLQGGAGLIKKVQFPHEHLVLSVIADGMGGRSGGRKASDQVMLTARQLFERFDPETDDPSAMLRQIVEESHLVIKLTAVSAEQEPHSTIAAFLINPGGAISQIRCLGYHSPIKPSTQTPSITTQKGIRLGSSYVEILRAYGQPDSYEKAGNILVLSYPKKHVQFQLINQKEQAEPTKAAYRVIAMTIATVEG